RKTSPGRAQVFEVVQRRSAMTRSTEPYRLDGKIALVTGGGSGIGEATCRELCSAGARVMIADIDIDSAAALAGTLDGAREIKMDVTDAQSIAAGFSQLEKLDILVNNAGIGLVGDILHTDEDEFSRLMRVNVHSVFLVTRAA